MATTRRSRRLEPPPLKYDHPPPSENAALENDSSRAVLDSEVAILRRRWELASVLNFLNVFKAVIGERDLKLSAEDIEKGLVKPDSNLANLHIVLLKGIPPMNKALNATNAWITILCKKLAQWWQWVAEGEMPLTASKGEEISKYQGLGSTSRLLILKALCELRAQQHDAVSLVNQSLKDKTDVSVFCKEKIGSDGSSTSYWCDGNATIGYRLYKLVNKADFNTKSPRKAPKDLVAVSFQWETLATNLKEFRQVLGELSSSKVIAEVAVGKNIENDVLPAVEKLQKKKDRAQKQKLAQERLLNSFKSWSSSITRSCRIRKPANYTFDDYDRAIKEAIEVTKKRKTVEEEEMKQVKQEKLDINRWPDLEDQCMEKQDSMSTDTESDEFHESDNDSADKDADDDCHSNSLTSDGDNGDEDSDFDDDKQNLGDTNHHQNPRALCWSRRAAYVKSHPALGTSNLVAKNKLRQRPTRNSALDYIVPDSPPDLSVVADSEDESDS